MGIYNPDAPRLLGQQWVPIREEDIGFAPAVNSIERGHSYGLTASRRIRDARFYMSQFPNPLTVSQVAQINTYPAGREALSGPIKQVIIPVSFASITGIGGTQHTLIGAATLAEAFFRPDDQKLLLIQHQNNVFTRFSLWFDVPSFPQLAGKRILNVSLDYSGTASDNDLTAHAGDGSHTFSPPVPFVNPDPQNLFTSLDLFRFGTSVSYGGPGSFSNLGTFSQLSPPVPAPLGANNTGATIGSLNLGDVNPIWTASASDEALPWRYDDLLFFNQAAGANRYEMRVLVQIPISSFATGQGGQVDLYYFALRVTYCEETRVMYGGSLLKYQSQTNIITQRDLSQTADPVLAAGKYTTTLSFVSPGEGRAFELATGNDPKVNGLREIYAMPDQPGLNVKIPFPLDSGLGSTFTKETSHVLPQISLHTSGGVLTEIHPYGRQSVGQVFGVQTVTQEVLDGAAGGTFQYPQVRFYARRFGDTTVPLTLSSPTITGAGTSVSITPADFDQLDEILNGWKKVDLRFSGTINMGAGTNPQWVWSASGELAGNRWEILGADAPALSGVVGATFNLAAQQLSAATYGQPSSGSTINEGWLPQGGPFVTGSTDDQTSDAVLIFSQDMPTVTGFTVTGASQPLSGIGLNCAAYPWYVPSAMSYNQITWSATSSSVPVSGFGYYEIQRMDTLTDWQTIAHMTAPSASGFKDYEARIGLLTSYRIRAVNSYLFAGQWSSTATITMAAPGLTGLGMGANAYSMIFSSNYRQDGSRNLAYALAFNADTTETFNFPEAGFTQYQFMYNRDFQVAFRPLERGGETFTRDILVQGAAIPAETLADFKSLRDMAWDTLPYVCVRDGDGNRWFANVTVPNGRVQDRRKLYIATVNVIEVTDTAAVIAV
jgi:hypothetical protein